MANEELPITPRLISWARTRAGLSLEEASKKFKRISEWEAGKSGPTYPQLEALAEAFKVPIAVFFFPEPPDVPDLSKTFRTLPKAELDNLPSRILLLLRKAKAMQLNLGELNAGRNPSERFITTDLSFNSRTNLVEMARQVREYLDITIESQQQWKDVDTALKEWRQALIAVGVYVFKDAFRTNEYSGFCLYDELFPIIYVNNSSAKTRQIFTLFHELAHLLFHTSGIDTLHDEYIPRLADEAERLEILCNRFAAEFLIPDSILTEALIGKNATEATAQELATRFHVSREFVFRRLLDRELINEKTYEEAAARWAKQKQPGGPGGDYYWTKLSYLGRESKAVRIIKGSWWVDFRSDHIRHRKRSPENSRAGAQKYEAVLRQKLARGETIDKPAHITHHEMAFDRFAQEWIEEYVVTNNKYLEQRAKKIHPRRVAPSIFWKNANRADNLIRYRAL